jgi:pimeloyl-ACP methyl ester carboxylesterase
MPVYHTEAGTVEALEWGDGPDLLVMLHAAAAGPQSLAALATQLLRPGLRIVAPALNRYGVTVIRDESPRLAAHAAVLRAVLERYPAERRTLFGHSMGGLIGLIEHAVFDAMVLYEPIVVACVEDPALVEWDRAIVEQADVAAFVTAWNDTPWEALPDGARARLSAMAPTLIADMRAVSFYHLDVARLRNVRAPVLLLQGERSPPITHAMTARLAALLPNARRVVVAGCGHMGPVQHPAVIASAAEQSVGDCFVGFTSSQ